VFLPLTSATNRFSFLTKKWAANSKKNRALGISNRLAGPRRKKKYFKVKKERKIKGKVEAGVCMCVARINRRIYCSWENANGFGNP